MNRFLLLNLHTFFIWSSFSFKREVGYVDVKDLPGRITFTRNRFLLFSCCFFLFPHLASLSPERYRIPKESPCLSQICCCLTAKILPWLKALRQMPEEVF